MQVLYPLLSSRGAERGAAWDQHCLSEHSMVEQSLAECLALKRSVCRPTALEVGQARGD